MTNNYITIVIVFLFIPLFLFGESVTTYLSDRSKITYSLEIPKNRGYSGVDDTFLPSEASLVKEKRIIKRSWILVIESQNNKDIQKLLDTVGVKNLISIKSDNEKSNLNAIGPFLDKDIALKLRDKIINLKNINISLKEITE